MIDLPENELFSAYLDGELTAEEQAQVEQLLATSAAARQLMDELRTLSSTLQALPAHKPGVDLSQRALRAAERQILSGGDVRPERDEPPLEQVPSPASIVGRDLWKRVFRPRSLLWAAAIFLVALFIRLQEAGPPNPPAARSHDGEQIAMAPPPGRVEEPPSIHAPEKRDPSGELERAKMAAPPARETVATVGSPNHDLRVAEQTSGGANAVAKEGAPGSTFGSRQPAAPSNLPMASAAAPAEMPALRGLGAGGMKPGATVGLPNRDFRTAGKAGNGSRAAPAPNAERAETSSSAAPDGPEEKAPADDVALREKGDALRDQKGESQHAKLALQEVPQVPSAPPTAAPRPAKGSSRALKSKAAEKVLLVECEVTFQADREHVFEKMLADQQLSDRLANHRRRGAKAGQGGAEDKLAAGKPADASDRRSWPEAAKKDPDKDASIAAKVDALAPSDPSGHAEKRAQVAETRSFEVEATPQQLGAILQRLKARRNDFPSVTSSPEVYRLRYSADQAASDGAEQKQVDEGLYAAPGAFGLGGSIQHQGMAGKAIPVPASPPSVAMEKAAKAGGPMEESQRPNLAESRKDLASQQGKAAEQKKTPQATPPMAGSVTLTPRTASVPARGQAPGSALGGRPAPTYRVRFVLRVVSPEASAAGSGVADRAPPSAKPAESKPAAAPVPTAAPAAAPSK